MRIISIIILLASGCDQSTTSQVPAPKTSLVPTSEKPAMSGIRWESANSLSDPVVAVLSSAFDQDYPLYKDEVNAYDFPLYHGQKGMDWWNFPWDLLSSRPQYTLTFDDMKAMLQSVKVKPTKHAKNTISYGHMLKNMVDELTPEIMNAHGGYLRVIKIIYCIRNFLSVAIKNNLIEEIPYLKQAAEKILSIYDTGKLVRGSPGYPNAKDIDKNSEDRNVNAGILSLKEWLLK